MKKLLMSDLYFFIFGIMSSTLWALVCKLMLNSSFGWVWFCTFLGVVIGYLLTGRGLLGVWKLSKKFKVKFDVMANVCNNSGFITWYRMKENKSKIQTPEDFKKWLVNFINTSGY